MVASFMPSLAFAAAPAHTHDYTAVTGATVDGTSVTWANVKTAVDAGSKYVHVTKKPTCTESGEVIITCNKADCSDEFEGNTKTFEVTVTGATHLDTVDKEYSASELAAQLVKQEAWTQKQADAFVASAALEQNKEGYCYYAAKYCLVCDEIVIDAPNAASPTVTIGTGSSDDIKPVAHDRNDNATCASKAACIKCGKVVAVKTAKTHDVTGVPFVKVKDATCEAPAREAQLCKVCGEYVNERNVSTSTALAHKIDATEVTETVAKTGANLNKGYFSVTTKDEYGDDVVKYYKYNATVTKKTVDADPDTCAKEYRGIKCSTCGKFINFTDHAVTLATATVYADDDAFVADADDSAYPVDVDHDFGATTEKAATCSSPAVTTKTCKVCDEVVNTPVVGSAALKHEYKIEVVDADCLHNSSYKITCKNCKMAPVTVADETIHTSWFTTDANNDKYFIGVTGHELAVSNYIKLPKATTGGHKPGALALYKAATCTSGEIWAKKCTVCQKVIASSLEYHGATALNHKNVKIEYPATCGNYGYYVEKCENCNKYVCPTTVDATGYTEYLTQATKTDNTAEKPLVAPGASHTLDKWVVTKASTVFEEGVKTLTCSVCGHADGTKTVVAKKTVAKAAPTVKAGKKSFNVKSSAANATGYRVYYKKAGAKSWKSYTKKTDSLSKTFSKLSKGKYYVKVKAYAKNYAGDGEVVWGEVSSTKTVTVK